MQNIYLTSTNPMHNSHLNTLRSAEEILGENVILGICKNELKDDGLFSLEKRAVIAEKFFKIPKEKILLLKDKSEIVKAIRNSKRIIRGIRDQSDQNYIKELSKYYGVQEFESKLLLINVPDNLKEISSSKLVKSIKEGSYEADQNWIPEELLLYIKSHLGSMQT